MSFLRPVGGKRQSRADLLNERGERVPSIISIDRQTNEITDLPVRRLRIPEKIGNTELTKQEQDMLRAGLPLKI